MNDSQANPRLDYKQTRFLTSAHTMAQCPEDEALEAAFIGRSNAGKSSAINVLTQQKGLARTSKTPGRTQLLNFFEVAPFEESPPRYLVDLPGFGFAKVPPAMKRQWQQQIERYLQQRRSLRGLVLLMDVRHPLRDFDLQMIEWADQAGIPLHVLLTKADKLKRGPASSTLLQVRKTLAEIDADTSVQLFSALKKQGVEELARRLDTWLTGGSGSGP